MCEPPGPCLSGAQIPPDSPGTAQGAGRCSAGGWESSEAMTLSSPSRYVRLCEVVDHVFPLLKRSHSSDFPCSDTFSNFTFWREPLPPFENQDVHSASA